MTEISSASGTGGPFTDTLGALIGEYKSFGGAGTPADLKGYYKAALAQGNAALCLSGGGIRSAAFALGVVQALARMGLLTRFQYLSTVSGGGYTGAWLSRWILDQRGQGMTPEQAAAQIQDALARSGEEPPPVARLREDSNYLTPQLGVASPDTWTAIVLWVRNVLLNWLVFLPGLLLVVLVPNLYFDLLGATSRPAGWVAAVLAFAGLLVSIYGMCVHLPTHHVSTRSRGAVKRWVVWPALGWAALLPVAMAPYVPTSPGAGSPWPAAVLLFLATWAVAVAGYLGAMGRCWPKDRQAFVANLGVWVAVSGLSAAFLGLGVPVATWILGSLPAKPGVSLGLIAMLGPLWITLAHLLCSTFFVGFRRIGFGRGAAPAPERPDADPIDADREWLARASAEKVIPALMWALFAAVCLPLPSLVLQANLRGWATAAVAAVSGPVAVVGGRSALSTLDVLAKRGQGKRWLSLDMVVTMATIVFAIILFASLAHLEYVLAEGLAGTFASAPGAGARVGAHVVIFGALALALWFTSRRINVNRFSLHALYRNRLAREFLGSANSRRQPHPFTGFDTRDNARMHHLRADDRGPRILFPVINLTLNATVDQKRLAWQERKAVSFTVTPLACGSAMLDPDPDRDAPRGAFVDSRCYAGVEPDQGLAAPDGLSLATAMTISGAAVSPSMGYNSSPITAFLMTLFNVRLGAWLPNPAYAMRLAAQATERAASLRIVAERDAAAAKAQIRKEKDVETACRFCEASGPRFAVAPLKDELLGLADRESPFVYLSDGGHFENLGIYEMVRRRCRYILVSDAGCDPDCEFADLGNAVRKIAIDLQVPITFERILITPRSKCSKRTVCFALARIHYPEADGDEAKLGRLLYVKPTYLLDLPVDVRAYAAAHGDFPHETTTDQWFSESQFESYRQLGAFLAGSLPERAEVKDFFDGLRQPPGDAGLAHAKAAE